MDPRAATETGLSVMLGDGSATGATAVKENRTRLL